jgi:hypothetical protein
MKLLITLLSIICSMNLFSQNMLIEWQSCFGGGEDDYAIDMIEVPGGYLILGNTFSFDGDISFNHGVNDLWLVRTDTIGNILWERSYGGSESDGSARIIKADGNNFYIVGAALSSDGDITNDPYPGSNDYWIVKIDSSGNILWDRIVGGSSGDWMWTGTSTFDGGLVALGWTGSDDGDVSIHYDLYDIWMVKLSREGEVEWDFTLGTDYQDYGQTIVQTADGGYLVGCASEIYGGGNLNCESHGHSDAVLVKLDSSRNIEWQECYGGSDYDGIIGLLEIEDGYLFLGYASSNDGDILGWHEGYNHLGDPTADIWVVKVDFSGNIIWQKCLGGSKNESSSNIFQLEDGSFRIFGVTQSNDGDVSGNHTLSEYDHDIWVIKIGSEGELLSQQCFGGIGDDRIEFFGVVKKSDNDFVIAGQTDYQSFDVTCGPTAMNYPDYWVFEIKDTTVAVPENRQIAQLKVYPNPAKDYVIFEHNVMPQGSLRIYNPYGQMVAELQTKDEKTIWDTRHIPAGTYIYTLKSAGFNKTGKIVITK